jgi:hypothetical protein
MEPVVLVKLTAQKGRASALYTKDLARSNGCGLKRCTISQTGKKNEGSRRKDFSLEDG